MSVTFISSTFKNPSVIQKNALFSWKVAGIPYILLGDNNIMDAPVIRGVRTENSLGFIGDAPLINDMINCALPFISTPFIAIINSDILIEPNFLEKLTSIINKYGENIFLTSVRRDTNWNTPINNIEELNNALTCTWTPHQNASADLFLSNKLAFKIFAENTGNFIYGRLAWDNWIHLYFKTKGIPCFNTSNQLILVHQKHGYDHIQINSFDKLNNNPSVNHNLHLLGHSVLKIKKSLGDIIKISAFAEP